jgi:hypothetical protein
MPALLAIHPAAGTEQAGPVGDLRNKMWKLERDRRQAEWLAKNCPPALTAPPITCTVCGAPRPWVVNYDRWRPPLYLCDAHLPDWAAYDLENGERQDRMCNLYSMTRARTRSAS